MSMSDYVKTMRSMIGSKPLLICGASVIIVRDGHILLQKRSDNGCWGYHGGCLEPGEYLEDAAKRELYEETGLTVRSMKFYGTFSGPDLHYVYPHGDEVFNVDTVFVCDDFEGELHADADEVAELRWFPLGAVPENLNPPVKRIIHEFVGQYAGHESQISNEGPTFVVPALAGNESTEDFRLKPGQQTQVADEREP